MKRNLLHFLALIFIANFSLSQTGFYVKGDNGGFRIMSNTTLYVDGDFEVIQAGPLPINKLVNGKLVLTGDLITSDTLYFEKADSTVGTPPAELVFLGEADSRITGSIPASIYQLRINKTSGNVIVEENTTILDTVNFINGNVIIDTNRLVDFKYRLGTASVFSNPFILGETAAHRFLGPGKLHTKFPIVSTGDVNVANTGFYFFGHNSDTLELFRGHEKQIYAGNGSIDRYFDIHFTSNTTITPDTIAVKYINDVDYLSLGVDTNNLGMYLSPLYQDIDYRKVEAPHYSFQDSVSMNEFTQFAAPTVNISSDFYRVTLGDTACDFLPISGLPDSVIHLCQGDSTYLQALNGVTNPFPIQCYWTDGLSGPNRYISSNLSSQEFVVQLIDSRGCYLFDTVQVAPTAPFPDVSLTWDDACIGDSSSFYNGTTITSGTFTSNWNFGDGTSITTSDSTIQKLYATDGSYTFNLSAISNYGCVSDSSNNIDVFNLPTPIINASYNCVFDVLELNDAGTIGTTSPSPFNVIAQQWSINGNQLSTLNNFNFSPLSPGLQTIKLLVTSGAACQDSVTETFNVTPRDTAKFTTVNACIGTDISLSNISVIQNSNASYQWSFSDGSTSTLTNPLKSFATAGIKTIELVVMSDGNCSDTVTGTVEIYDTPSSLFDVELNTTIVSSACLNTALSFTPSSITSGASYAWDFGDLGLSTAISDIHAYTSPGVFNAVLTTTDANGCVSLSSSAITIWNNPVSNFTANTVCEGVTTNYISNSTGSSLSYEWLFGDGNASAVLNPSHPFGSSGNYTTSLVITDGNNCTDTSTNVITVNQLPYVNLGNPSTCGTSYILDAQNSGSTYLWTPSNVTTQTVVVNQSGTYSVSITDANGCSSSSSATVTLNSSVDPYLGADTSVCGSIILDAGYPGSTYEWQDFSTSSTFIAASAGTYYVQVTDPNGCIGSDTIIVQNVYPPATPNLGNDISTCLNSIQLNPGTFSTYTWSDLSSGNELTVNSTGSYSVLVSSANGCLGSDTINVVFNASPISALGPDLSACDQATVLANANASFTFLWDDASTNQSRLINQTGQYTVIITNPLTGCTTSDTINAVISPTPVVNLGTDITVCSFIPIQLDATTPGASYEWISTANVILGTNATYEPASSGLYLVNVDLNGCVGSDAVQVTLLPAPVIPAHQPIYYICGTTGVNLSASPFGTNLWQGPNGFTSTNETINVFGAGDYIVTSQVSSCVMQDTFSLEVSPNQIEAFYLVDSDTTKNLALVFIDLSDPTPISYYWDFGDGTFDTVANPIHTYSTVDTFNTSLTVSNGICLSTFTKQVNQKTFYPEPKEPVANLEIENLLLYPNPNNGVAKLELTLNDKAEVQISMFDATGKVLQSNSYSDTDMVNLNYDLTAKANGIYFLKITVKSLKGELSKHVKLVKTNN